MIHISYFARYRELLGLGEEQLDWEPAITTIELLRQFLVRRGDAWQVLAESNLMCARNQELVSPTEPLADGDEIAFFPPVTGG